MSFETVYAEAKGRILLDEDRARGLYEAALDASRLQGEFWECGVYKGGSARIIASVIPDYRPFRLFDSFKGLQGIDSSVDTKECIHNGWLTHEDQNDVRHFVNYPFVAVHAGLIPDTFRGLEHSKIAFAYIDVDLYRPTRDALAFILPRMVKDGIIVVDDYGDPDWPGVSRAMEGVAVKGAILFGGAKISVKGTQLRIDL